VVQVSDTHLAKSAGVPAALGALLDWIEHDPPDLLVHTGDIVYEDPDDDDDREFARRLFDGAPCPLLAIPGNHDIGFYGEVDDRERRITAFVDTWGADRFSVDVAGWRLVGANAYLLGEPAHDAWLREAVTTESPVAVFIHQPLGGDPSDGWEMPQAACVAFDRATAGADIRLVASGHRHRSYDGGRIVWAPSTTIVGEPRADGTDPALGAVEFTFHRDGTFATRFVRP
jgi:alkaline phosphatase D